MEDNLSTEEIIINAAERVFVDKGFAATKTIEIAKIAGVNHAMIHYYFRTKENLFNIVFRKKVKELADSMLFIFEKDIPFFDKLRIGISTHFDFFIANNKLALFIANEINSDNKHKKVWKEAALPIFKELINNLSVSINKEIEKGTIRPIKPIDLIINIVSLNIFFFITKPMMLSLADINTDEEYKNFLEQRKKENVYLIIKGLEV